MQGHTRSESMKCFHTHVERQVKCSMLKSLLPQRLSDTNMPLFLNNKVMLQSQNQNCGKGIFYSLHACDVWPERTMQHAHLLAGKLWVQRAWHTRRCEWVPLTNSSVPLKWFCRKNPICTKTMSVSSWLMRGHCAWGHSEGRVVVTDQHGSWLILPLMNSSVCLSTPPSDMC